MYIIILIIIFIIIFELYYVIKNLFNIYGVDYINKPIVNLHDFNKNIYTKEKKNELKFNKFFVNGDKKIDYKSGKIFTNEDYNIFIQYNNKISLIKKNIIYDIPGNFILEIIDVNEENIIYYYTEL